MVSNLNPFTATLTWCVAAIAATGTALAANRLDPAGFPSLGTLDLPAGEYLIDTTGSFPVIQNGGGVPLFSGALFDQSSRLGGEDGVPEFNAQIAVFAFDSIHIDEDATITARGDNPLALLSHSTIVIDGVLDASGEGGANATGNLGGTGDGRGGVGGPGAGKGGDGGPAGGKGENGHGPGGGYGWFSGLGSRGNGAGFGGGGAGGNGGTVVESVYGDLRVALQAGSGGGGTGTDFALTKGAGGGGGGGGVELGAASSITIDGELLANGGGFGGGATVLSGGGSGGGLLLHAPTIAGNGDIEAMGGGPVGAGGGGGGRILFLTSTGEEITSFSTLTAATPNVVGAESGVIEFDLLDGALASDFDGDGDIDGEDFLAWQTNFGTTEGAGRSDGDADGDGDVDGEDFLAWQTGFGTGVAGGGHGANSVPEPSSAIVAVLLALVVSSSRRTR